MSLRLLLSVLLFFLSSCSTAVKENFVKKVLKEEMKVMAAPLAFVAIRHCLWSMDISTQKIEKINVSGDIAVDYNQYKGLPTILKMNVKSDMHKKEVESCNALISSTFNSVFSKLYPPFKNPDPKDKGKFSLITTEIRSYNRLESKEIGSIDIELENEEKDSLAYSIKVQPRESGQTLWGGPSNTVVDFGGEIKVTLSKFKIISKIREDE